MTSGTAGMSRVGTRSSSFATVQLTVTAPTPTPTPIPTPTAQTDTYNVTENVTLTASGLTGVLANDTDPDKLVLSATLVTGPAHGRLTFDLNGDGGFEYIPATGYAGTDTFVYKATDTNGRRQMQWST